MDNLERLVGLARGGDAKAFGLIYSEYFTPIYRFVYWRTRHKETAEDITQNVFLRAYESIGRFADTGAPLLAWLYTIARNLCVDHFKKKKDVLPEDPDKIFDNLTEERYTPLADAERSRNAAKISMAVAELSSDQQEVVILRFVEERSYEEIAKITGKSEEALRAINYRAMKSLQTKLRHFFKD